LHKPIDSRIKHKFSKIIKDSTNQDKGQTMGQYNFIPTQRDQDLLLPPSLREWLPEQDLSWFIIDAVSQMNLEPFYTKYRNDGWGNAAYDPEMMVSLMLYAYCLGVRSSRQIERRCERDIAFRVITANQKPDHTTIARFRQANQKELSALFTEVLRLCAEAGLVNVGLVALDGTKVKANASLGANRTYVWIEKTVQKMLEEAAVKDEEEDQLYGSDKRGDELPEDLQDRDKRLARLKEAKQRLKQEAEEAVSKQAQKIKQREEEERDSGKKKRGRKPKHPNEKPQMESKANTTDPQSRIMKTRTGYVQGYNAQAVVTEEQIIVAADVTQEENDKQQLHPMLEQAQAELSEAGVDDKVGTALQDAGYWSENNILKADPEGPELLIATTKDWKQRKALREKDPPRGRIPKGLSAMDRMERKLRTRRGWGLYKRRGYIVEPIFGQIKEIRRCDHFMRRGHIAVQSEWRLIAATHNLLKLWRSGEWTWT
jgi:transposase